MSDYYSFTDICRLPILTAITGVAIYQLWDGVLSRLDAIMLIVIFLLLMGWTVWQGMKQRSDEMNTELSSQPNIPVRLALFRMISGLIIFDHQLAVSGMGSG